VTHCFPKAPASRCFRALAQTLAGEPAGLEPVNSLVWERLLNDWVN